METHERGNDFRKISFRGLCSAVRKTVNALDEDKKSQNGKTNYQKD
jgi:hypothetical protein